MISDDMHRAWVVTNKLPGAKASILHCDTSERWLKKLEHGVLFFTGILGTMPHTASSVTRLLGKLQSHPDLAFSKLGHQPRSCVLMIRTRYKVAPSREILGDFRTPLGGLGEPSGEFSVNPEALNPNPSTPQP